jgi:hypothetical protein
MPTVFEAKYHGTCVVCDESIDPGQDIYFTSLDEVVHYHCPERSHDDPAKVCPDCWLIHPPGECP